jgi:hypothetical protein
MDMFHIRLHARVVARLKERASLAGASPGEYVETVLWYAGLENARVDQGMADPDSDEILYFSASVSLPLRRHMIVRSEEHELNLSAYAGILIERYLAAFERDPGDLRMLARVNELLQRENPLTEAALLNALQLARNGPVSRMPPAYQARWLHQRLAPFVPRIQRGDTQVELTLACIGTLWEPRE